tara:strand:- start:381 stop:1307 length:927 start_codon:yes stop_codon:yes gene_type:complete
MSQENQQGQVTDLEDSLFTEEVIDEVFNPVGGNEPEPTPSAPAPVAEGSAVPQGEVRLADPTNNDEVRYQYWQSEADKAKNENEQLKQTVAILQDTIKGSPTEVQSQPEIEDTEPEPFRDSPEKPTRPVNFNRAEAYDDPNSASAQYLDQMDQYRDSMDEWNRDRVEYEADLLRQERESLQEAQRRQQEAYEAEQRNAEQVNQISQQLKSEYGANDAEIADFVEKMSSPESLNVNNLWRLYQMDKGQVPAQQPAQPSPQFNQVQRAQSVPQPMGVQSSANMAQNTKSAEDIIMDDLITDYKSKNPWNS